LNKKFAKFKPVIDAIPDPSQREKMRTIAVLIMATKVGLDPKTTVSRDRLSKSLNKIVRCAHACGGVMGQ
jgi:hypothetical protein